MLLGCWLVEPSDRITWPRIQQSLQLIAHPASSDTTDRRATVMNPNDKNLRSQHSDVPISMDRSNNVADSRRATDRGMNVNALRIKQSDVSASVDRSTINAAIRRANDVIPMNGESLRSQQSGARVLLLDRSTDDDDDEDGTHL